MYNKSGHFDKGLADCTKAIELNPNAWQAWQAWTHRGWAYGQLHQYEKAVADYPKAIELNANAQPPWFHRGSAHFHLRQWEKAIADFAKAIQIEPKGYSAWLHIGQAHAELGQWDNAVADYSKVIDQNAKHHSAWLHRGLAHAELDQWDKAITDFSKAIELKPDAADAFLVKLFNATGRPEQLEKIHRRGIAVYEKLAADHPNLPDYLQELANRHRSLADVLRDSKRPEEAEQAYRQALEIYGQLIKASPDDAELYCFRGDIAKRLQDRQMAIADSSKSIALNAKAWKAWNIRAWAYFHLHQYEKAVADYSKVIDLNAKHHSAWLHRGHAHFHLRQWEKAIADFAKGEAWFYSGQAHAELGQWDNVVADFSKAIELNLDESHYWYYRERGKAYGKLGQQEQAQADFDKYIELLTKAIEKDPDNWSAWDRRGVAHHQLEEWEKALTDFSKAIELNPNAWQTLVNRAGTYSHLHHWDKAVADYRKAIDLGQTGYRVWYELALAHLANGDTDSYKRACVTMVEHFGQTEDFITAQFVAWSCALAPDAVAAFSVPIALAQQAAEVNSKVPFCQKTLGAILYRAGRCEEAIERLTEARRLEEPGSTSRSSPAYTWFFLAMAHQRLGDSKEAKQWLGKAAALTDEVLAEHESSTGVKLVWNRRLTLELLRQEVQTLLKNDD